MKTKLQFALDRALDAARELIEKEIHHIVHAFNLNDQKLTIPLNLEIHYQNDGQMRFKSRVSYKQTVETDFEYDPDQQEFDFTFPGSNFDKLDLSDHTTGEESAEDDEAAETAKTPTKDESKKQKDAAAESPELFS